MIDAYRHTISSPWFQATFVLAGTVAAHFAVHT